LSRASIETLVGFLATCTAVLLVVTLIQVGRLSPLRELQTIWVRFDDARYLSKGNNVRVDGMDVGYVAELTLLDSGVLVKLITEPEVVVREKYKIMVRSLTTLGGQYVEIVAGDSSRARVRSSREKPFEGVAEPELMKAVSAMFSEAEPHIVSAVANMGEVFEKVSTAQGTLGKLLAEDGFQQDFRKVSQRFEATTKQMNAMLAKVTEASGTLGMLLYEPRFGEAVSGLTDRVGSIGRKVGGGTGVVGAVATDEGLGEAIESARAHLDAILESLTAEDGIMNAGGRAAKMREDLSTTIENLGRVQEALAEGRGPLIAVTQDPDVQRNLERTRAHLAAFADRPQHNNLARIQTEQPFLTELMRAFQNYGGNNEITDVPPVSGAVMGYIRGQFEPPPRGGLRARQGN